MKDYSEIIFSLHNHFGNDLNDAVGQVADYLQAAVKCGYKKVTMTGHGSCMGIQTGLDYIKKENLDIQIVYGIEVYVEFRPFAMHEKAGHLILLAPNERGKQILIKLNSKAEGCRLGKPVISRKQLEEITFNGDVIATSACVSGAPALALSYNKIIDDKIKKLNKLKNRVKVNKKTGEESPFCLSPDDPGYLSAVKEAKDAAEKLEEKLNSKKDIEQLIKEIKASVRKLIKAGEDSAAEADKGKSYTTRLEVLKEEIKASRKEVSAANKKLAFYQDLVDEWNAIQNQIKDLEASKKSDDELFEACLDELRFFNNVFGQGNYFAELQYHGFPDEKKYYPIIAKAARKLGIPLVAANDAHMPDSSEKSLIQRNVARYLRFQKIDEQEWDKELYVKTPNQLAEWLLKILPEDIVDEAMNNLNVIGERCNYVPKKVNHAPSFGPNAPKILMDKIQENIPWRYSNGGWTDELQKRVDYEYGIITSMGFADYFLIVQDFLEYGRIIGKVPEDKLPEVPLTIEGAKAYVKEHGFKTGEGIGLGRGSGAGSLIAYILGITNIDPIRYGLIFERFLNPERVSMPDIDSDLAVGVREKTIEYVKAKYGEEAVVGIITETREGVKGAIRDAARYLGGKEHGDDKYFLSLGNLIRKKVPAEPNTTFDSQYNNMTIYEMLLQEFEGNTDAEKIIKIAKPLEGMLCGYGQHAAGVVIYGPKEGETNDITNYIPIRNGQNGKVTEMDMIQVEAQGLLKMDFLGLKTLNIITDTEREIEKSRGIVIDADLIPVDGKVSFGGVEFDSKDVYKNIFAKGNTKNVFQFESPGMRKILKQMK